jgi:hypothetical protein
VPGLSDVDLTVLAADDAAAGRIRARWRAMRDKLEPVGRVVECHHVVTPEDVAAACRHTVLTHGLDRAQRPATRMQERPVVGDQLGDWRLIAGPDLLPRVSSGWIEIRRPAVAWLNLQYSWRHAFVVASAPRVPWLALSCVKLVAEPAGTALWLADGRRRGHRAEVLAEALDAFPEERDGIAAALDQWRVLPRSPEPDIDLMLSALAGISRRIAAEIIRRAALNPGTAVDLVGADTAGRRRELPLVDWRARVLGVRPDPVFVPVEGDIADRRRLLAAVADARPGVYPAVRERDLLVMPTADAAAARLRGIECPPTDPVSFALAEGRAQALFPDLPGWAARDCALRAVAEHARLLRVPGTYEDENGEGFARLFAAARAALFLESVEQGDPELVLTAAAASERLRDRAPADASVVDEACAGYLEGRESGRPAPPGLAERFRGLVRALPAFDYFAKAGR